MQANDIEALFEWSKQHLPGWQGISSAEQMARFEEMTAKNKLWFSGSKLSHLPEALGGLLALQAMDLRRNPLQALPERIGDLSNLTSLEVSDAHFAALPLSFTRLTRLVYCTIGAKLTELPQDFGNLSALEYLDLSSNRLDTLPDSMQQLTRLHTLRLHVNRFTEMPDWVGRLPALKKLDVHFNPLTHLPDSVNQSETLHSLGYNQPAIEPELACWRAMRSAPLGEIQFRFAKKFAYFGHQLPPENVLHRRAGIAGGDEDGNDYGRGDTVHFVFGQDERGEYLDYYMAHRLAGDQHGRIREDGSCEELDVVPEARVSSPDPQEDARLEAQYQAEVSRIYAELSAKGFAQW